MSDEDDRTEYANGNRAFHEDFARAEEVKAEPPRPLTAEIPPASEFPIDALGDCFARAVEALHRRTQAPLPICGNAVLALAALAVQPYADIVLPIGVRHPLSLFLITVAESGDRKSTVDDLVLELVRAHEAELAADYEIKMFKYSCEYGTWKRAQDQILKSSSDRQTKQKELQDLGPEPARPWYPMRICNEPTFEGLVRALDEGWPSMGVFSDEGAQFIAGHAMSEDHRLKTAAAFCDLWAGNTIRRVRAGTGLQMFAGRRVSLHLMIQPLVARRLFADPVLRDQGLLSRLLTVMPASAAGTRLSSNNNADNFHNFQNFHKVLGPILRKWMPIKEAKTINPRALPLSEVANKLFFKYADDVETRLKAGGDYECIKGLANKLPEHASRLGGVLELIGDIGATHLGYDYFGRGIQLAEYYAEEARRIYLTAQVNQQLIDAQKLLDWIRGNWQEKNNLISLPDVYREYARSPYRDQSSARQGVDILVDHGHLVKCAPAIVNGHNRREVWTVIKS